MDETYNVIVLVCWLTVQGEADTNVDSSFSLRCFANSTSMCTNMRCLSDFRRVSKTVKKFSAPIFEMCQGVWKENTLIDMKGSVYCNTCLKLHGGAGKISKEFKCGVQLELKFEYWATANVLGICEQKSQNNSTSRHL